MHPFILLSAAILGTAQPDPQAEIAYRGFRVDPSVAIYDAVAGFQTLTIAHEYGHKIRINAVGVPVHFETGNDNVFKYYVEHRIFTDAATLCENYYTDYKNAFMASASGLNNETYMAEYTNIGPISSFLARISVFTYYGNGGLSDILQLSNLSPAYTRTKMEQAQAGALALTAAGLNTFAYFNPNGISYKSIVHYQQWKVALEVLPKNLNDTEVSLGYTRHGITPTVVISKHGISGDLNWSYGPLQVSYQCNNPHTLTGMRNGTNVQHTTHSISAICYLRY